MVNLAGVRVAPIQVRISPSESVTAQLVYTQVKFEPHDDVG